MDMKFNRVAYLSFFSVRENPLFYLNSSVKYFPLCGPEIS